MAKRTFDKETYQKIGSPNINSIIYFLKEGKKVYGKVVGVKYHGFKGNIQLTIHKN